MNRGLQRLGALVGGWRVVEKVWGRGVSKKRVRKKNRNQWQRISWKQALINLL